MKKIDTDEILDNSETRKEAEQVVKMFKNKTVSEVRTILEFAYNLIKGRTIIK